MYTSQKREIFQQKIDMKQEFFAQGDWYIKKIMNTFRIVSKLEIKNKNLVLVANGEIYNDLEIRNKYSNYRFKTNSDSESILAVYKNKGIEGFKELRGMYAFAIYNEEKDEMIIYGKGMIDASDKKISIGNLGDHRVAMCGFILSILTIENKPVKYCGHFHYLNSSDRNNYCFLI